MYKICFYVPDTHIEQVKNALFESGAGQIGNYRCCAWQVEGVGQFMPFSGSNAFIGQKDQLEKISEYKVEMVCDDQYIHDVINALKKSHPYETPAYHVIRVEDF